ncbi:MULTISPECIES: MFS transporter [Clostridia]|uniref:DHA3 family macrolide efflux protein-like MFS transporter n=2 Tax=Lachnospiraceae TaxID=186803 RepID=A0A2Y9BP86_9FIRM|nr:MULTISPECIES: MFS transporter [Clostridia]MDY4784212.1 MFS transporter [Pygmaiobacter massiliensis]PWJ22711.1 DHA3 family macrolide efflux protein-like MFS transporter [Faecalicatena orotica]SHM92741.1 MFS transporter, DHA3 family, macrolide efflux protein [Anaerosporobacter mobilis DSM 15930]SSA58154.1 MFS transporter, DHA3 family, macrolide efflux protein [Faecalicatena orotica]
MQRNKNLWKKDYFTILIGQGFSLISSGILQMSIIFYLTAETGSAMVLSIATLIGFLPQALIGPFAGVFVDRHSRKKVMIGADLVIAAAGGVLAIVTLYMDLPIWVIMGVLFVRSMGTAFHSPALNAATPLLVPEDQLTKCAGYSQTIQAIGSIISPAAAAFLYTVWNLNHIVLLDIVGAAIACISVAIIAIPNPLPSSIEENVMQEMKAGYMVLKENKGLFALLWIGALYMFFYMPISALYPLMSMGYFGGTPTHASIAEIAFAIGMLVGGVILSVWGGFKKRTFTIGASVLMMGIGVAISGILPSNAFIAFAICCMVMGVSAPFYGVQNALFQEKIKPEYLGRVFSLLGSVMSFAMPLGLLCSGLFAEQIGVEKWFLISGIGIITISFLVFILPVVQSLDNRTI